MKNFLKIIFLAMISQAGYSQISSFPYLQDFETTDGGWNSGGTGNDWAWGHPNKSIINQAGGGQKCWITGGLTGSSYSNGERSFIESPDFNFSSLTNPFLEFKIYVETEQGFDGAGFQYSTNNGLTWINVGAVNEPNNCFTNQWFNTSSIMYLTGLSTIKEGWSGNSRSSSGGCSGGGGTFGWVSSKHCLKFLAGQTRVRFRFIFGAGTSCNSFDGFAFDDFSIKNATALGASFSTSCLSPGNFRFTDTSPNCPNQWTWDFGDGSTGSGNLTNHFFSPGKYQVRLIASNSCSQPDTSVLTIPVLGIQTRVYPVSCFGGSDGKGKAIFTGIDSSKSWLIHWNTSPTITATDTLFGLLAGNYQVSISQNGTCTVTSNLQVIEPPKLSHQISTLPTVCTSANGKIEISENGGTPPFQYVWSPSVSNSRLATNLSAGNYTTIISDANGCKDTVTAAISSTYRIVQVNLGLDTSICPGEDTIEFNAGIFNSYLWNTGETGSRVIISSKGLFHVTVSDTDGCMGSDSVEVKEYCSEEMWIASAFSPNEDGWNDDFGGLTSSPKKLQFYSLRVYDRWGQELFFSNRYENRWNGGNSKDSIPTGAYPYLLSYQFQNGKTKTKKGMVTILR